MFAAFLTTILFSISVVCGHRSAKLIGGTEANFWRLTMATLMLGVWAYGFGIGLAGDAFPAFFLSGILGIGIGTLFGNLVFIYGGKLIASKISNNQHVLNWIIGGIFALTALIQLYKIYRHKDAEHDLDHPEDVSKRMEGRLDRLPHKKSQQP